MIPLIASISRSINFNNIKGDVRSVISKGTSKGTFVPNVPKILLGHSVCLRLLAPCNTFLQRTGDLVLISKPCARSGRMVPFYFPVKNARNERPLSLSVLSLEALEEPSDPSAGTSEKRRCPCLCAHNRLRPKRPLANEQSQMGTDRLA
jgi:hypothetical protein